MKTVAVLALALLAAPLAAGGQPVGKMARVGVLFFGTPDNDPNLPAFREGLRQLAYVEGRNIVLEYRFAGSRVERAARSGRRTGEPPAAGDLRVGRRRRGACTGRHGDDPHRGLRRNS